MRSAEAGVGGRYARCTLTLSQALRIQAALWHTPSSRDTVAEWAAVFMVASFSRGDTPLSRPSTVEAASDGRGVPQAEHHLVSWPGWGRAWHWITVRLHQRLCIPSTSVPTTQLPCAPGGLLVVPRSPLYPQHFCAHHAAALRTRWAAGGPQVTGGAPEAAGGRAPVLGPVMREQRRI